MGNITVEVVCCNAHTILDIGGWLGWHTSIDLPAYTRTFPIARYCSKCQECASLSQNAECSYVKI